VSKDIRRILSLAPAPGGAGGEAWIDNLHLPEGTMRLLPHQREALSSLRRLGSVVGAMGVGSGKTLVFALAPRALQLPGSACVLLVPPTLVKTARREFALYAVHFDVDPPIILPYSALSATDAVGVLDDRAPRVILADEAHYLRHSTAARTRRVFRYLADHAGTRLVPMSGTLLGKSVRDAWHLAGTALGPLSPLPTHYNTLEAVAQCSDVESALVVPSATDWSITRPLTTHYGLQHDRAGVRAALERRFAEADGVVATTRSSAAMALNIATVRPRLPKAITDAIRALRSTWELPDGTCITQAPQLAAAARQLAVGFYYAVEWGEGGPNIPWLHARSTYAKALQAFLTREGKRRRLDTPGAVEALLEADAAACGPSLGPAWLAWKTIEPEASTTTYPVWLTDDVLLHAKALADEHDAILWYSWIAVGARLRELGMEVFAAGDELDGERRVVAASIEAHGTGRNLQAWDANVILAPPASGTTWEQLLGRTHRQGQQADEVRVWVYQGTQGQRDALASGLGGARYLEGTTGQPQKLLLATFV